jgi:hypothetical protein
MDWKTVGNIVGKSAPILGTLLGGPAGAAIGGLVGSILGTEATPDAIHQAIAADPNKALELAQYELENKAKLQEMTLQHAQAMFEAEVKDRGSARQREVDTKDTFTPRSLAYGVTVGFFGTLAWLLSAGKPEYGGDVVLVMLGSLGTAWTGIISYYFGSSSGSDRKTELIAKQNPATEPNVTGT